MSRPGNPGADLVRLALECGAVQFGDFTLKSGRPSPYFFNFSKLCAGPAVLMLGKLFATRLLELAPAATVVGIPYKGISLAALACAFATQMNPAVEYRFVYLRKEAKDHGEKGLIVGDIMPRHPVVMIDDVLTAATAVTQTIKLLRLKLEIDPSLLLVGFDRGERMRDDSPLSTATQLGAQGIKVSSLAHVEDLYTVADQKQALAISAHLARYGASSDSQSASA